MSRQILVKAQRKWEPFVIGCPVPEEYITWVCIILWLNINPHRI